MLAKTYSVSISYFFDVLPAPARAQIDVQLVQPVHFWVRFQSCIWRRSQVTYSRVLTDRAFEIIHSQEQISTTF